MRTKITRTITATTISSGNVSFKNGKPIVTPNDPITLNGIIPEDKAIKEVRKAYGATAQVTEIKSVDDVYEINVDDFIKYATKVVAPTPEQKQEGAAE
jgi:hypothetical protein